MMCQKNPVLTLCQIKQLLFKNMEIENLPEQASQGLLLI